ncbi:MAG: protoporphyrinogen oxidase HemJ [Cohaesibacteraceae bacterium]|nr:protoporphyrinogen oxidase HemJ [Cohaesibacteraceae bacterium]
MLWIKAFHIVSVISWMAGLLYLPRLFVYHSTAVPGSELSLVFKTMERRLMNGIMTPAMILSWVLGLFLAFYYNVFDATSIWLHIKFVCVVGLTICHFLMKSHLGGFAHDKNQKSARYFRILNEVPTVLMLVIVVLAVVKPW